MKIFKNFFKIFLPVTLMGYFLTISCGDTGTGGPTTQNTTVSGTVVDGNDNPIQYATVEALNSSDESYDSKVTDKDGKFTLENIPENLKLVLFRITHPDFVKVENNLYNIVGDNDKDNLKIKMTRINNEEDTCCNQIELSIYKFGTDNPLAGVEVKLKKDNDIVSTKESSSSGTVLFDNLCDGEYSLRLAKDGYNVEEKVVDLNDCDSLNIDMFMKETINNDDSCCHGVIFVAPKGKDTGQLITGAKVKLYYGGQIIQDAVVQDKGVTFDGLCEGTYAIEILAENYQTMEFHIELGCDEHKEIVKILERTSTEDTCCHGVIVVIPKDRDGHLISGATVILNKDGKAIADGTTTEHGYTFSELCEGNYTIVVKHDHFQTAEIHVELGCNKQKEVVVKMEISDPRDSCCKGVIVVIPKDSHTEEIINGAVVKLRQNGKVLAEAKVENGRAIIDGLCEGSYDILITAEGYQALEYEFELRCNEERYIVQKLQANEQDTCCKGIIWVIPKDETTNQPIVGAKVFLYKDDKLIEDGLTTSRGAGFDGLCEGTYAIVVKHEKYHDKELHIELGCNEHKEVVVLMLLADSQDTCCNGIVYVYVKEEGSGESINGATVRLWKAGKILAEQKTERGFAKFVKLCKGEYAIDIITDNYKNIEFGFLLGCDEEKEFVKHLSLAENQDSCCHGIIYLKVTDESSGANLKGVLAKLYKGNELIEQSTTNADGLVTFDHVCEGNYQISLISDTYKSIEFNFEMGCDDNKEFHKTLALKGSEPCEKAVMKIVVTDVDSGDFVTGAHVVINLNGQVIAEGKTGLEGFYQKTNLHAPAEYVVVIEKEGYQRISVQWKFTDCKTYSEVFRMEKL